MAAVELIGSVSHYITPVVRLAPVTFYLNCWSYRKIVNPPTHYEDTVIITALHDSKSRRTINQRWANNDAYLLSVASTLLLSLQKL